ncbi:MAG: Hsp70 family protein, partial [Armatimonadetes bacterium]|nr:Hsp70 family protein [Armatimonadota bacterium]
MILGIDLGTEWCRLTTADEQGQLQMISSAQRQDQKTPVAVCYVGEWLWGWSALDAAEPAASDLKRCFGRRDVGSAAAAADGQSLLEEFLRGLRLSLLEMFGRHRENHIVLTVPYWFGIRERQVVRQSLANAGLHVDAIINDAEAALIACHVENHIERGEKAKVLVVDAGAESTVLSLLEVGWQDDCLWPELISYDDETPGFRSVHRAVLEEIGFQGDAALSHASITLALGPLLNQESDFTIDLQGREWQVRQEQVKTAVNAWNAAVKAGLRRLWQTSHVSAGEVQIALATGGGCEIERARQTIATFPIVLEPPANARPESLAAWGAGRYALMLSGRIPRRFRGPQMPAVGLAIADGDFHPILEVDHGDGCPDFRVYA